MFCTISVRMRAPLLVLALALPIAGCQDNDDDPSPGDTEDGGACPDCEPGQEVYLCIIDGKERQECFDDLAHAQASCGLVPGNGVVGNAPMPCDNQTPDPPPSWKPGSYVVYDEDSHTHQIARELFLSVIADPSLLLNDRARLEWRGDRFEFVTIAEGDLASALGFMDGDALVEVNGHPLSTFGEIASAYDDLREQSSFTVTIVRDEATVVLSFLVVDDD